MGRGEIVVRELKVGCREVITENGVLNREIEEVTGGESADFRGFKGKRGFENHGH